MEVTKALPQFFRSPSLMATTLFVLLSLCRAVVAAEVQQLPWRGNVTAEIHGTPANLAWPFFADFCNIYRIFPLSVSFCVSGVPGRVGQHRYVASVVTSPSDFNTTYVRWEKHNLTAIVPVKHYLSYEIMENNLVVKTYRATMSVLPTNYGSLITWAYTIDPIRGYTYEQFRQLLWSIFQRTAKKIENASINLE